MTAGPMRVGWARADCSPGYQLGSDEYTWAFDGYNVSTFISMLFDQVLVKPNVYVCLIDTTVTKVI
jgi:hypothetical protein